MSILVGSVHTSSVVLSTSAQTILSRHFASSHFPSHPSSEPWLQALPSASSPTFSYAVTSTTSPSAATSSATLSVCGHGSMSFASLCTAAASIGAALRVVHRTPTLT
ncbi:hypothetical protein B0H13DRAFT_2343784 [Mycena leptocephala]|nr:hypothetical protein B0H13DRAFT_2343784 [Mycena leptocephala]